MKTIVTAALSLSLAGVLALEVTPAHARSSSGGGNNSGSSNRSGNDSKKTEVKRVEPKVAATKSRTPPPQVAVRRDPPVAKVSKAKPEPKERAAVIAKKPGVVKQYLSASHPVPKADGKPNGGLTSVLGTKAIAPSATRIVPRPDGTANGAATTPTTKNHHSASASVPKSDGTAQGAASSTASGSGATGGRVPIPSTSTSVPSANGMAQGGGNPAPSKDLTSQAVPGTNGAPLGLGATGSTGQSGAPIRTSNAAPNSADPLQREAASVSVPPRLGAAPATAAATALAQADTTAADAQRTRQVSQSVPPLSAAAANLRATAAAAAAAATIATGSVAAAPALWRHNGSTMKAVYAGDTLRIAYDAPRSGLASLGIAPDTQLFQGRKTGSNTYAGDATTFSKTCGPANYPVSGEVAPDQRSVTLKGRAPARGANCQITSYRDETLVFDLPPTR